MGKRKRPLSPKDTNEDQINSINPSKSKVIEKPESSTLHSDTENEQVYHFSNVASPEIPLLRTSARVLNKQRREVNLKPEFLNSEKDEYDIDNDLDGEETSGGNSKKRRRAWEMWMVEDKNAFFDAINECGKDFEAIHNLMVAKLKRKNVLQHSIVRNKEQVRHFYYRQVHKVSKYIKFSDEIKKPTREIYALVNYGEFRKKIGARHFMKNAHKLEELIYHGSTSLKMKGKSIRVKTPVCRALKKLNDFKDEALVSESGAPVKVSLEILPETVLAWNTVQSLAHNPRVRFSCSLQRPLCHVIEHLQNKWKSPRVKACENMVPLSESFLLEKLNEEKLVRLKPPVNATSSLKVVSLEPDLQTSGSHAVSLSSHLEMAKKKVDSFKSKPQKPRKKKLSICTEQDENKDQNCDKNKEIVDYCVQKEVDLRLNEDRSQEERDEDLHLNEDPGSIDDICDIDIDKLEEILSQDEGGLSDPENDYEDPLGTDGRFSGSGNDGSCESRKVGGVFREEFLEEEKFGSKKKEVLFEEGKTGVHGRRIISKKSKMEVEESEDFSVNRSGRSKVEEESLASKIDGDLKNLCSKSEGFDSLETRSTEKEFSEINLTSKDSCGSSGVKGKIFNSEGKETEYTTLSPEKVKSCNNDNDKTLHLNSSKTAQIFSVNTSQILSTKNTSQILSTKNTSQLLSTKNSLLNVFDTSAVPSPNRVKNSENFEMAATDCVFNDSSRQSHVDSSHKSPDACRKSPVGQMISPEKLSSDSSFSTDSLPSPTNLSHPNSVTVGSNFASSHSKLVSFNLEPNSGVSKSSKAKITLHEENEIQILNSTTSPSSTSNSPISATSQPSTVSSSVVAIPIYSTSNSTTLATSKDQACSILNITALATLNSSPLFPPTSNVTFFVSTLNSLPLASSSSTLLVPLTSSSPLATASSNLAAQQQLPLQQLSTTTTSISELLPTSKETATALKPEEVSDYNQKEIENAVRNIKVEDTEQDTINQLMALQNVASSQDDDSEIVCLGESTHLSAHIREKQSNLPEISSYDDDPSPGSLSGRMQPSELDGSPDKFRDFYQNSQCAVRGWTINTCENMTIGELYLMFGRKHTLTLEYDFVSKESMEISPEKNIQSVHRENLANSSLDSLKSSDESSYFSDREKVGSKFRDSSEREIVNSRIGDFSENEFVISKRDVSEKGMISSKITDAEETEEKCAKDLAQVMGTLLKILGSISNKTQNECCNCGHNANRAVQNTQSPSNTKDLGTLFKSPRGNRSPRGSAFRSPRTPTAFSPISNKKTSCSSTEKVAKKTKPASAKRLIEDVDKSAPGCSVDAENATFSKISYVPETLGADPVDKNDLGGEFRVPTKPAPRHIVSSQSPSPNFNRDISKLLPAYKKFKRKGKLKNMVVQRQLPILPNAPKISQSLVTFKVANFRPNTPTPILPAPSSQISTPTPIFPAPSPHYSTPTVRFSTSFTAASTHTFSPTSSCAPLVTFSPTSSCASLVAIEKLPILQVQKDPSNMHQNASNIHNAANISDGNAISVYVPGQQVLTVEIPTVSENVNLNMIRKAEHFDQNFGKEKSVEQNFNRTSIDHSFSVQVQRSDIPVISDSPNNVLHLPQAPVISDSPNNVLQLPQTSVISDIPNNVLQFSQTPVISDSSSNILQLPQNISTIGPLNLLANTTSVFSNNQQGIAVPVMVSNVQNLDTRSQNLSEKDSVEISSSLTREDSFTTLLNNINSSVPNKELSLGGANTEIHLTSERQLEFTPRKIDRENSNLNTPDHRSVVKSDSLVTPVKLDFKSFLSHSQDSNKSFNSVLQCSDITLVPELPQSYTTDNIPQRYTEDNIPQIHIPDNNYNLPLLDISLGGTVSLKSPNGQISPIKNADSATFKTGSQLNFKGTTFQNSAELVQSSSGPGSLSQVQITGSPPQTSIMSLELKKAEILASPGTILSSHELTLQSVASGDTILDFTLANSNSNSCFKSLLAAAAQAPIVSSGEIHTPQKSAIQFPATFGNQESPISPPSSPSRLLPYSEAHQWIQSASNDFSLSSLLGSVESPIKGSSGTSDPVHNAHISNLLASFNDNSVDFTSIFAKIKQEQAERKSK